MALAKERAAWPLIERAFAVIGGLAVRIEATSTAGTPDIAYTHPELGTGFIEQKRGKYIPERMQTSLDHPRAGEWSPSGEQFLPLRTYTRTRERALYAPGRGPLALDPLNPSRMPDGRVVRVGSRRRSQVVWDYRWRRVRGPVVILAMCPGPTAAHPVMWLALASSVTFPYHPQPYYWGPLELASFLPPPDPSTLPSFDTAGLFTL